MRPISADPENSFWEVDAFGSNTQDLVTPVAADSSMASPDFLSLGEAGTLGCDRRSLVLCFGLTFWTSSVGFSFVFTVRAGLEDFFWEADAFGFNARDLVRHFPANTSASNVGTLMITPVGALLEFSLP